MASIIPDYEYDIFISYRQKDNKGEKFKRDLQNNSSGLLYKSIAVLPFENMSKDSTQQYFSDGLTDGILNSLEHLKDLKVYARTKEFQASLEMEPKYALTHVWFADKTFDWLDKAYDERSNFLVWLQRDPRWGSIRSDKRYTELVRKVGLPT